MTLTTNRCPDHGVYVACLASYNNGVLHGAWLDLEELSDADDIHEAIKEILAASKQPFAEEYAIHDVSGMPAIVGEYTSISELASYAEAISQANNEDEIEAYNAWCDNIGVIGDWDDFRSDYQGLYSSTESYCMERAEEQEIIPAQLEWPLNCIDWEMAWRELDNQGAWTSTSSSNPGWLHIFSS